MDREQRGVGKLGAVFLWRQRRQWQCHKRSKPFCCCGRHKRFQFRHMGGVDGGETTEKVQSTEYKVNAKAKLGLNNILKQ